MSWAALSDQVLTRLYPERALSWTDYAEAHLAGDLGRVLDYGCGRGILLERLSGRATELWGVDVDDAEFPKGASKGDLNLRRIDPLDSLPFTDEYFDTCIITEVIEHVADERFVLVELARVLRAGGRLVLTTPHRGLLTWLDPANYKFAFPTFHRWIHSYLLGDKAYYQERFGENRRESRGMIADFTTDQDPWHRHYTSERIRHLAPASLKATEWAVYFPAMRALWLVAIANGLLRRTHTSMPRWLEPVNSRLSRVSGRAGDQLVVCFQKLPSAVSAIGGGAR